MSNKIVEGLVKIGAVSLNLEKPFIWASGINSPIYCDNRKTLGHYEIRSEIAAQLYAYISATYPKVEVIGGTATAGIPHATSVADKMNLPLVYFRSKAKDHGTKGQIEGDFTKGQKVVIIEDLVSTGGSVIQSVQTARDAGMEVLAVVSIFNYELESAMTNFVAEGIENHSILTFSDLSEYLKLNEKQQDFLSSWRKDPFDNSIWGI